MSQKEKELTEEEKAFEKKCELVKKEVERLKRRAKEPIPEKILRMRFTV